jgi:hypothetical protein
MNISLKGYFSIFYLCCSMSAYSYRWLTIRVDNEKKNLPAPPPPRIFMWSLLWQNNAVGTHYPKQLLQFWRRSAIKFSLTRFIRLIVPVSCSLRRVSHKPGIPYNIFTYNIKYNQSLAFRHGIPFALIHVIIPRLALNT